jgi:hypothetical protein
MYDQSGKKRDHRQKTDPEHDLFDQIAVGDDTVGSVGECFGKIEPGEHSRQQPKDKREVVDRLGFEPYLKHEPENEHCSGRLNECPENSQKIPYILLSEIIFGQGPQKFSVLYNGF